MKIIALLIVLIIAKFNSKSALRPNNIDIALEAKLIYENKGRNWPLSCTNGKQQSPINIQEPMSYAENLELDVDGIVFNMYTTEPAVFTKGLIKVYAVIGKVSIKDPIAYHKKDIDTKLEYECRRIVFHSPAEHRLYGVQPEVEMQVECDLVTKNLKLKEYQYRRLILSYFFDSKTFKGDDTKKLLEGFRFDTRGEKLRVDNFRSIMKMKKFVFYYGSRTQPPCSEKVIHVVDHKIYSVSRKYIDDIHAIFIGSFKMVTFHNARDVQDLNNRGLVRNFEFPEKITYTMIPLS